MKSRILIASLLLLTLALAACAVPAAPAASDDSPAAASQPAAAPVGDSYAKPDVLVDTAWIKAHLDDPNVRLIDVSGTRETYDAGHLPGAIFVAWNDELNDPADPVQGQVLTQDALTALMSRLGIENDDTLVFYDDSRNLLAARSYWALKYYQHADVRIYNGGSQKWVADGNELSAESVSLTPSDYVAQEADTEIRTTWQYVVEHVDDPSTLYCDARGPTEYAGTDVRAARGGHVPGAINVEWVHAVQADGTFKDAKALAELYTKAGFTPDKQIITYCQTAVRGAHTWFVLRELLGYPNVRNYDGSWVEYGNNPNSPIEQ